MSLAFATHSRRRRIVLGALTLLLHLVVLDWVAGYAGRPREERAPKEAQLAEAELLPAPAPTPVRPAPVPPPQPTFEEPPLPELKPEPVEVAEARAGAPDADDAAQAAVPADGAGEGAQAQAGQGGAALAAADVQSGQPGPSAAASATQQQAQQAQQPQPAQPVPEAKHYKVDLPPAADIVLDVARTDANGTKWSGEATLSWSLSPAGYRIQVEAGVKIVFARVNLLTLTSEGAVGEEGFMPSLMTEKRRGRALTATHFNRKDGRMSFSATEAHYPLVWGAQDKASVPLQMTAIARGDPQQLQDKIDILVGEDRDASVYTFVLVGKEEIDTHMGKIATWHLSRPAKAGSYKATLDLWLAPDYGWYPVQIRNVEASGAVTTQTVNNIVIKNSGS